MVHEFNHIVAKLSSLYGKPEAQSITYILFEDLLEIKKNEIFTTTRDSFTEEERIILYKALDKLLNHVPIQHITGFADFMGLKFKVNKHVLIPRQETEELVILCLNHLGGQKSSILDIGIGSGCIPIAMKKVNPLLNIVSIDVSVEALLIAKENAIQNNVEVDFIQMDILDKSAWKKFENKFDLIISNPPYVTQQDKELMQKNVLEHEPELALFVPEENPLIFYKAIAEFGNTFLKNEGTIFLEINESFGPETKMVFENEGYQEARIIKDFHGKNRMLEVRKFRL